MSERVQQIEAKLRAALEPESLDIIDDSHKHAGHAGSKGGAGHFDLTIVSDKFSGMNTIGRHRLIYDALSEMMPGEIHALSIKAFSPEEI
ncbi:MAG: BolA family transcriptional regulator [Proteobacteria bacterium]|nr:BolA family transcriptional regulator [Pseudomonadota bacterium]